MNINLTLIGQTISFAMFVWFCMKFIWPPLLAALDERKAKIADGLAAAERGLHEKELAQERAKETLKEAKEQANDILMQAQKRANEIINDAKDTAKVEGQRIIVGAQAEIEQEIHGAREQLRKKVAELAVLGAEKILHKEINVKTHEDMIDILANSI